MIDGLPLGNGKIVYYDYPNHVDPTSQEIYQHLKEDLIQIVFGDQFLIDVGWYPSFQKNGKFILFLIENYNWEQPVYRKKTRSINMARGIIEEYVEYIDSILK